MSSNKNSRGSHALRGKYAKNKVLRGKKEAADVINYNGSRIINLY